MSKSFVATISTAALLAAAHSATAQCDGRWVYGPDQSSIPDAGVNAPVEASVIWDPDDDGPEPAQIIIGGQFGRTPADSELLLYCTRWDGRNWRKLGPGLTNGVTSLTLWDPDGDGPLKKQVIASGAFLGTPDAPTSLPRVARWDGAQWHALPDGGLSSGAITMTTWDPDGTGPLPAQLIAAGNFATAGGSSALRVARHNGTEWLPMGAGFDVEVATLTSWDPDGSGPQTPLLIAGGRFLNSGSTPIKYLARWDEASSQWVEFAGGASRAVYALGAWDSTPGDGSDAKKLIVSGLFSTVGTTPLVPASRIAMWDGSAWSTIGGGLSSEDPSFELAPHAEAITSYDPDGISGPLPPELLVVGAFLGAGGVRAWGVTVWNGSTWREIDGGLMGPAGMHGWNYPYTASCWDPDGPGPLGDMMVVGGSFSTSIPPAGAWTFIPRVTFGDGSQWLEAPTSLDKPATAVATFDPDGLGPAPRDLVLGGTFDHVDDITVRKIASWDGAEWDSMDNGISTTAVQQIVRWDPDGPGPQTERLVVATNSALVSVWDGAGWTTLPDSLPAAVVSLTLWDPDGAGSMFPTPTVALGNNSVRYFDGTGWIMLGAPFGNPIKAIASVDHDGPGPKAPVLYCGGEMFPYQYIVYWTGAAWVPVGGGANSSVLSMIDWDIDGPSGPAPAQLAVTGSFSLIGGVSTFSIATWDGVAWHPVGGFFGVHSKLGTWDPDGPGPLVNELVSSGDFILGSSRNIARWDGVTWRPFGSGLGPTSLYASGISAFDRYGPGAAPVELVAAGNFTQAGGQRSTYFARWTETGTPWIARDPHDESAAEHTAASLTVSPAPGYDFDGPLMYQWRRDGVAISDGPGGASAGGGSVSGSDSATLVISGVRASDEGGYDCIVSNGCGAITSGPAELTVTPGFCPADLNQDGLVDFTDYLEFLNLFDAGDLRVDFTGDGIVDFSDYLEFLNLFDAGC